MVSGCPHRGCGRVWRDYDYGRFSGCLHFLFPLHGKDGTIAKLYLETSCLSNNHAGNRLFDERYAGHYGIFCVFEVCADGSADIWSQVLLNGLIFQGGALEDLFPHGIGIDVPAGELPADLVIHPKDFRTGYIFLWLSIHLKDAQVCFDQLECLLHSCQYPLAGRACPTVFAHPHVRGVALHSRSAVTEDFISPDWLQWVVQRLEVLSLLCDLCDLLKGFWFNDAGIYVISDVVPILEQSVDMVLVPNRVCFVVGDTIKV